MTKESQEIYDRIMDSPHSIQSQMQRAEKAIQPIAWTIVILWAMFWVSVVINQI